MNNLHFIYENDTLNLKQKRMKKALVIGASSGIGLELARVLAENDYMVGVTGRRENLLKELSAEKTGSYVVQSFDLKDMETIESNLNEITAKLGELDLVVISA